MEHRNSLALLLLLVTLLVLFCSAATLRDLTYPDELRYAEVAREMLEGGNWILPHFNYEIYPDKPPVFFWLLASSMEAFGQTPLAALLPSILASLLTIWLTFLFGRKLFDHRVGLAAAFVLSTFLFFQIMAQVVRMDMLLTFLTTATLFLLYRGVREEGSARKKIVAAYFLIGIALITKGPVGFILPVMTVLLYLLFSRRYHRIRHLFPPKGLLIMAAIPLLWLLPAGIQGGGDYLREILFRQSSGRLVASFSHAKPIYFYLLRFPLLFLPWSLYLLLYLSPKIRKGSAEDRDGFLFLSCWVLGTLTFFSLISGKIVIYLLPLIPGLALFIARAFMPLFTQESSESRYFFFQFPSYLLGGLCLVGAGGLTFLSLQGSFLGPRLYRLPMILVLAAGGILLLLFARKRQVIRSFLTVGGLSLLLTGSLTFWLLPKINPSLSLKPMARKILALEGDTPRVAGYKVDLRFLAFYLHAPFRKLDTPQEIEPFLRQGPGLLLADLRDMEWVAGAVSRPLREVGRFRLRRVTYLLLVSQEDAPDPAELPEESR
jgi:4-amino-4-deoxy-L-arabinose transferase-like glycosyltransferase